MGEHEALYEEAREFFREYHEAHRDEGLPSFRRYFFPATVSPGERKFPLQVHVLRALFCSIIAQAAFDYVAGIYIRQMGMERLDMPKHIYRAMMRRSNLAHEWLFTEEDADVFSFLRLCEDLGFVPSAVLKALTRFPLLEEPEQRRMLQRLAGASHPRASHFYYHKRTIPNPEEQEGQWWDETLEEFRRERRKLKNQ